MTQGLVFWFTGLSGVGKTTLAQQARRPLEEHGFVTRVLDGDDVRDRLHCHLGFTESEIKENNALIAGLCRDERKSATAVLVPIISPYAESRHHARALLSPGFFEIHIHTDIPLLEARDPKGLYAKARSGEMNNLIGYSSSAPYEPPEAPDLRIDTGTADVAEAASVLTDFMLARIAESRASAKSAPHQGNPGP